MDLSQLNISGDWHNDAGTLEKFSRDMSAYRIAPALVVEPEDEQDVVNTVQFTRNEGLSIVPRPGGSDMSGAFDNAHDVGFLDAAHRLEDAAHDTLLSPQTAWA